jgi:hypothetical protein
MNTYKHIWLLPLLNLALAYATPQQAVEYITPQQSSASHPSYIRDKEGRTLIFRKKPEIGSLIVGMFLHVMGIAFLSVAYYCTVSNNYRYENGNPVTLKDLIIFTLGSIGIGCFGLPFTIEYFRLRNQRTKPIIILDAKGIHDESWPGRMLWSDITHIEYNKFHHYRDVNIYGFIIPIYIGFSWRIELHTRQKQVLVIDDRETQIGQFLHQEKDREKDGGLVCQLIMQYYNQHKFGQT